MKLPNRRLVAIVATASFAVLGCASLYSATATNTNTRAHAKPAAKKTATKPVPPAVDPDAEKFAKRAARLWSLQPVHRPDVPTGVTDSSNPIDAFIAADWKEKGLRPAPKADKLTLLRRVRFDRSASHAGTGRRVSEGRIAGRL